MNKSQRIPTILNCVSKNAKESKEKLIEFEQKQKEGEKDVFICNLIQKDLIDEFIEYVKKTNFRLMQ